MQFLEVTKTVSARNFTEGTTLPIDEGIAVESQSQSARRVPLARNCLESRQEKMDQSNVTAQGANYGHKARAGEVTSTNTRQARNCLESRQEKMDQSNVTAQVQITDTRHEQEKLRAQSHVTPETA
ncbi:hypothetical protein J6590_019434 [Homalodisca vitripennis]|nr:hypothetical protein J6590_019434 [Homalodisca vitripennis]